MGRLQVEASQLGCPGSGIKGKYCGVKCCISVVNVQASVQIKYDAFTHGGFFFIIAGPSRGGFQIFSLALLISMKRGCRGLPATTCINTCPKRSTKKTAYAMNRTHVEQPRRSLNVSAGELKTFFGISLAMPCLAYPQIQMYWKKKTRVPLIANSMARNKAAPSASDCQ